MTQDNPRAKPSRSGEYQLRQAPVCVSVSPRLRVPACRSGFTLLEILVALALATVLIGAVFGLISESLRYKINLKEKALIQPVLESAAQIILADPAKAMQGSVRLDEYEGSPLVGILLSPVQLEDTVPGGKSVQLYRVMLSYKSASLEFSIIVPNNKDQFPSGFQETR